MLEEKEHLLNNSLFDSSFAQGDQTKSRAAHTADLEETQRPKKKINSNLTKQLTKGTDRPLVVSRSFVLADQL